MTEGDLLVVHVVTKHAEEAAAVVEGAAATAEPEVAKKGKAPAEGEAAKAAAPAGKDVKKDKK